MRGDLSHEPVFFQPTLLWRAKEGKWQEQRLYGATLTRRLKRWLRQSDLGIAPLEYFAILWEGRKWFVILWEDGYVQAVTLR